MLTIKVPTKQFFDEETGEFLHGEFATLELEHSLVSLSKWESEHERPFLGREDKSTEEIISYIKCMIVTPDYPEELIYKLTEENVNQINEYINKKMTATWFRDAPGAPKTSDVITAELIYYWMTVFNIPFECQHWHLNRLFTLIRVCNAKQSKPKKMGRAEAAQQRAELNARRRAELNTKG